MTTGLVWLRHDLRCYDNPALFRACSQNDKLIIVYIYDDVCQLQHGSAQKWWLYHSLSRLTASLKKQGASLILKKGNPAAILTSIVKSNSVDVVYWNRNYEQDYIERDKKIEASLIDKGIGVQTFNGRLLFEPWEVQNKQGEFFKVFTPFWKQCLRQIGQIQALPEPKFPKMLSVKSEDIDSWNLLPKSPNWASEFANYATPGELGAQNALENFLADKLNDYDKLRDIPSESGTSRLSAHLHFGEISPRCIWQQVQSAASIHKNKISSMERFLAELGWREFSYHLLYHFPNLPRDNFRPEFNAFSWDSDTKKLKLWQKGCTGYPIVDAGMRELWKTGYMHNRVRMIVASFLIKDLLIDWRLGAKWFWDTLLDADLANNSASWQWVAGSGADAAPYFRIFNPTLQGQKFDPGGIYVKKWIEELSDCPQKIIHTPWEECINSANGYPLPIVDHKQARKEALARYDSCTHKKQPSS